MNIIDNNNIFPKILRKHLEVLTWSPVFLGHYMNFKEFLDEANIDIVIEPGFPKNEVPLYFQEAKDYWTSESIRLAKLVHDDDSREMLQAAQRNLDTINHEIKVWPTAPIKLMSYDSKANVIRIYPAAITKSFTCGRVEVACMAMFAREVFHAFFRHADKENNPYNYFVEEPLTEFAMLHFVKECVVADVYWWFRHRTDSMPTIHRYGINLMDQYLTTETGKLVFDYLENYKEHVSKFAMPVFDAESQVFILPGMYDNKVPMIRGKHTVKFDGLYYIIRHGKMGVVNSDYESVIPCQYDYIYPCNKDKRFIVYNYIDDERVYGCLDMHGNEVFPLVYDNIFYTGHSTYVVQKDGYTFYLDKDGKRKATSK